MVDGGSSAMQFGGDVMGGNIVGSASGVKVAIEEKCVQLAPEEFAEGYGLLVAVVVAVGLGYGCWPSQSLEEDGSSPRAGVWSSAIRLRVVNGPQLLDEGGSSPRAGVWSSASRLRAANGPCSLGEDGSLSR